VAEKATAKVSRQSELIDGRTSNDSIRLWERYRDHAYIWRAVTILQFPVSVLGLGIALFFYYTADTSVQVPENPQPGHYSVKQLPDSEFIDVATKVVNLISTYQPHNARQQFFSARKFLWEPALSEFENSQVKNELRRIEETSRSQIFFIDTKQIKVERHRALDKVVVRLPGIRQKLLVQKPLKPDEMVFYVKMTTIPRNIHNEYGIVVVDLRLRSADLSTIAAEDRALEQEKAEANGGKRGQVESEDEEQPSPDLSGAPE